MIADTAELPVYRRIEPRVAHLQELGMSNKAIARALAVSDKTVAKASERRTQFAPARDRRATGPASR